VAALVEQAVRMTGRQEKNITSSPSSRISFVKPITGRAGKISESRRSTWTKRLRQRLSSSLIEEHIQEMIDRGTCSSM